MLGSRIVIAALFLTAPVILIAKAPTVRISVDGGGLTSPIDITDGELLDRTSAWGSEFLDRSNSPLKRAPAADDTYEVSLYSQFADNHIRKTCVFYYRPGTSAGAGAIYLPGSGVLSILNFGTVIREGLDGNWSHANPTWEALLKARIAAGRRGQSVVSPTIAVEQWTKPQAGWLYILDARSERHPDETRIWLLNPDSKKIMGAIRAGYEPDFALSPDGQQLFVVSGERQTGELAIIETATGKLRRVAFPDRVSYKPWYQGIPLYSAIAVSADGWTLWIAGYHVVSPEETSARIWEFDIAGTAFRKTSSDVGNCGSGSFVSSTEGEVNFVCQVFTPRNRLQFSHLAQGRDPLTPFFADFSWSTRCGFADVFSGPSEGKMTVIRGDGAVYSLAPAVQQLTSPVRYSDCEKRTFARTTWAHSADGATAYVGYGGISADGQSAATELRAIETATGRMNARIQPSAPFWSIAASPDARLIYAVSPSSRKVLVIDGVTLQEKAAIAVGVLPALAIVAR